MVRVGLKIFIERCGSRHEGALTNIHVVMEKFSMMKNKSPPYFFEHSTPVVRSSFEGVKSLQILSRPNEIWRQKIVRSCHKSDYLRLLWRSVPVSFDVR